MPTVAPKIPDRLQPVSDFLSYILPYLESERPVMGIHSSPARIFESDLYRFELRGSICSGLILQNCQLEKACFCDVLFQDGNFSGCNFSDAYFERCVFQNCKAVGTSFFNALFKNTRFSDSNFSYAVFDQSVMRSICFDNSNFSGASFAGAVWKEPMCTNAVFSQNNFFKADLGCADFSECTFQAPTVSDPPTELRGVTVNSFQASDIVGLFGIKVRT